MYLVLSLFVGFVTGPNVIANSCPPVLDGVAKLNPMLTLLLVVSTVHPVIVVGTPFNVREQEVKVEATVTVEGYEIMKVPPLGILLIVV